MMFGKLTTYDSSGRNPLAYRITQQFTYVGKDKDCDIRFENSKCAGKQFLLTANGNGPVKIQNLSKKYATLVNEKQIGFQVDHDLKEQDIVSAAGRKITWSYKTSAAEDLPQNGAFKRTRNSEPVRKVAVVTPNRRETTVAEEEESIPPKKRRKTVYDSSVSFYPKQCSNIAIVPEQSSFARRISYDKMLKGKATPSNRGRMSSGATSRRLAGNLRTPGGSAQKNKKLTFANTVESPSFVYNHGAAFNKSITPRTFYSGRNSNAPFTFRGFNPVPEGSSSSTLREDSSFLSLPESNANSRRSGRVSTPLPNKRLTSSLYSVRTPRNRSMQTGTPSVYFPTIQEGRLMGSTGRRNAQHGESYLYDNSGTMLSPLTDLSYGRGSTPASYFSPTSSGSPRMMRAESPNIQLNDANGVPRSLVSSGRSTPFGTPQEIFHQSQKHDSLFVNTSVSSHIRSRRLQGSFLTDQSHYGSHDSILQNPHSQAINTPARLSTPRRSRSVIETPGSSSFSPMSYNDTGYVLLSPRGRNLVSKRYERSDYSNSRFSQSPYSPSQNTLDFTASPPQHPSPRFGRTPKRSLSMQVLTKSLQKKANYNFNRSNVSAKGRKSQRQILGTSNQDFSADLLINDEELCADETAQQQRIAGRPDTLLDSDSKTSKRKTPRRSQGEDLPLQISRRSRSLPSGSPTQLNSARNSRKSGRGSLKNTFELKSSRLSQGDDTSSSRVLRRSQCSQIVNPVQVGSPRKSRKSRSIGPEETSTPGARQTPKRSGTFVLETDSKPSRRSSRSNLGEVSLIKRTSRRTLSVPSGTSTQSSSARKSRISGVENITNDAEPIVPPSPKRSSSFKPKSESNTSRLSQGVDTSSSRVVRRSQRGQSGSPAQVSSSRKSRKSENIGQEESSTLGACQTPKRSGTFVLESDLKSSTTSLETNVSGICTEDIVEPFVRLTPKRRIQGGENLSSRVSRRSQSAPSRSLTQLSSPRKSRKSDLANSKVSESVPKIVILPSTPKPQGKEMSSSRDPRRSLSVPSCSPAHMNRRSRKSGNKSSEGVTKLETPKPSGASTVESDPKSSTRKSSRLSQDAKSVSSGSTGEKRTPRKQTETSIARDVKPILSENGSIAWPVAVPVNFSAALQFSEEVKPLKLPTMISNKSLGSPTSASARKLRGSSALLYESASFDPSTSVANISAIPRLPRKSLGFSTPVPSSNTKSVKVTSTPFPKGLVSGRDDTREISSDLTLPIEIDTVNIVGSYISSDSPDYDRITDEESFDVGDVSGTSARTSLVKRNSKVNSKRSVSFVANKSGVKNMKSKTRRSKTVTIKEEMGSPGEATPPNTTLEINLRSSRKVSKAKKSSPSTPLTAGKTERVARLDHRLANPLSLSSLDKITSPVRNLAGSSPLATSLNDLMSATARRSLNTSDEVSKRNSREFPGEISLSTSSLVRSSPSTSKSDEGNQLPRTPRSSVPPNASEKITPPRTVSPEVVLRSSRKSARRSRLLSVPGTPTSTFKKNPRRSAKKASPGAMMLKRKLDMIISPGRSAVKKLKLDPDKPDKKKMAALWVFHKNKSIVSKQNGKARRSFDKPLKSPTKFNTTLPRNFKFQTSGSASSSSVLKESREETPGKSLTPIKDLDAQPQQLSPEDDLLNALDLSRKSAIVVEPQKPFRRLRSSRQKRTPGASLTPEGSAPGKPSSKSTKKLLFKSPMVEYEGSQTRGEPQVNSSNIKSILMPSPTTSSDEPMSRVFTTSPVVDYTDSSGIKKIFRASPASKSHFHSHIRELLPSEEIDLTGVRDLFESTPSPTGAAPSAGSSRKLGRKGAVVENQGVSPPKVVKVSPASTSSRRKRGAPVELVSNSIESTSSVVNESNPSTPASPKSPVRKLRNGTVAMSTKRSAVPKQKVTKTKKVDEAELNSRGVRDLFERTPSPTGAAPSAGSSRKRGQRGAVIDNQGVGRPKVVKVSPASTSSRRKRGAPVEVVSNSIESTSSVVNESTPSTPASPKSPVRKLRNGTVAKSTKRSAVPKQKATKTKKVEEAELNSSFETPPRMKNTRANKRQETALKGKEPAPSHAQIVASPKKLRSAPAGKTPSNAKFKAARVSVIAVKAAVKKKAVGSKTSKNVQVVASPKKLRSKEVAAPKGTAVKAPSSKQSPKKVSVPKNTTKKVSVPKRTPKKAAVSRDSPKKTRVQMKMSPKSPKKSPTAQKPKNKKDSTKISATLKKVTAQQTPEKASAIKNATKKAKAGKNSRTAEKASTSKQSPKKAASKQTSIKASAAKKAPPSTKQNLKTSPRKTRSAAKPRKPSPTKTGGGGAGRKR